MCTICVRVCIFLVQFLCILFVSLREIAETAPMTKPLVLLMLDSSDSFEVWKAHTGLNSRKSFSHFFHSSSVFQLVTRILG